MQWALFLEDASPEILCSEDDKSHRKTTGSGDSYVVSANCSGYICVCFIFFRLIPERRVYTLFIFRETISTIKSSVCLFSVK